MNEKLIDKYIQALSEKLGVAAKQVYETLYHQQFISGIMELFFGLLVLIGLIISIKLVINIFTKAVFERDEKSYYSSLKPKNVYAKINDTDFVQEGFIWILCGFVWVVLIIIIAVLLPTGIMKMLNPNYYALKEILDVFSR